MKQKNDRWGLGDAKVHEMFIESRRLVLSAAGKEQWRGSGLRLFNEDDSPLVFLVTVEDCIQPS